MFGQPLVSVGIPTFNRPEGLERTLQCISRQTYKNLEIIVSDNCSPTEATRNVIKTFIEKDSRIQYFRQRENRGAVFNFSFVLQKASGEYFMWASDDDEWLPNYVEDCLSYFENDVLLVCSHMEAHWRSTGTIVPIPTPVFYDNMSAYDKLRSFLDCPCPSMLYGIFRRANLVPIFNYSFDFYDCALIMTILSKASVRISPNILYRAGVDDPEYIVKPRQQKTQSKLIYWPFLKYTFRIVGNCEMKLLLKASLWLRIIKFVVQNYVHHEIDYSKKTLKGRLKFIAVSFANNVLTDVMRK